MSSFTSPNVGIYCPSGGWIDLDPYLKKDKINTNIFPAASRYYTQYKGKRCALPLLADAYGFYYNKKLFKKAGLTRPPKTFSELTAVREEADAEEHATGRSRSSATTRTRPSTTAAPALGVRAARSARRTSTRTASRTSSSDPGLGEAPQAGRRA